MGQHNKTGSRKYKRGGNRVRGYTGRLRRLIDQCLAEWDTLESRYLIKIDDGCYALRLLQLGYNEELRTEVLTEREDIVLYQVIGYNKKKNLKRSLGYCLLYLGNPIIHEHTWYVSICYSEPKNIGYKDWNVLYADQSIRLVKIGIGKLDYFLTYRGKTKDHDRRGLSDGAVRLATADNWKDGL